MIPVHSMIITALGMVLAGFGLEMTQSRGVRIWFGSWNGGSGTGRRVWNRLTAGVRQRRLEEKVEAQMPLLVENLVLGGQAGLGLLESLSLTRASLPQPLAGEVGAILDLVSVGHSLREALSDRRLSTRGPLRRLIEQLLAGEELGVSLEEVLSREAVTLAEIQLHRQEARVNSLSLVTGLTALLFLFPPLVLLILVPNLVMFLGSW